MRSTAASRVRPGRRLLSTLLGLSAAAALAVCGGSETPTQSGGPGEAVPNSVLVTPTVVALHAFGDSTLLVASVLDRSGAVITDAPIAWSSADPSVVSISDAGWVVAVGDGITTVEARSGEAATGAAAVQVTQYATRLTITGDSIVRLVSLGAVHELVARADDARGSQVVGAAVSWTSLNAAVATVDSLGRVRAVAAGSTAVLASADSLTDAVGVVVDPLPAVIDVTPGALTLSAGDTTIVLAVVRDAGGSALPGVPVAWSSSDEGVATVSGAGRITAVAAGSASITAIAADSLEAVITLVVSDGSFPLLEITTTALPDGVEHTLYGPVGIEAQGGDGTYAWEVVDGAPPAGVGLEESTGTLSGSPTAGSATFTVQVTSGDGQVAQRTLSITTYGLLVITTPSTLPDALRGSSYGQALAAAGGSGEYTWALTSGTLPDSLELDPASGTLGGAPVIGGSSTLTVRVTSGEQTAEKELTLTVTGPPPPFSGTIFIDPDIITSADPTTLQDLTYTGQGSRTMYDRRVANWITVDAYLFAASFDDGLSTEVQVNPEFGSSSAAQDVALLYATEIGRLPTALRQNVETVWIHQGVQPFGGGNSNILIHTGQGDLYIADGILEETLVHEASHTSLDPSHAAAPGWLAAQEADGTFISTYARDYPDREDVAESFLPYLAVRYRLDRISQGLADSIGGAIPYRIEYFDSLGLAMYPIGP